MLSVCTTMIWNNPFEIFSRLLAYTLTSMIELGEGKLIACTTWISSWCFCADDLCIRADWVIWLHEPAARLSDCSSFCSKPQHWSDFNLPAIAWTLWRDVEFIYIFLRQYGVHLTFDICSDHLQSSPLSSYSILDSIQFQIYDLVVQMKHELSC